MNKENKVITDNSKIETEFQRRNKRKQVLMYFTKPSLTKQEYSEELDINNIIKKFQTTGELPNIKRGFYADVTQLPDYHEAMNIVAETNQNFATLPAAIRSRFNNNPAEMLDWVADPKNAQEATKMGLLRAKDVQVPSTIKSAPLGQNRPNSDESNTTEAPKDVKSS